MGPGPEPEPEPDAGVLGQGSVPTLVTTVRSSLHSTAFQQQLLLLLGRTYVSTNREHWKVTIIFTACLLVLTLTAHQLAHLLTLVASPFL